MKSSATHASGRITRSTDEWLMSRSCQSATFSSAATRSRGPRARGRETFSSRHGLRLCGIAEEPFWPRRTPPPPRAPRCAARWRISTAILSSARRAARARRRTRRGGRAARPASPPARSRGRAARSTPPRPRARGGRTCPPRPRSCRPRPPRRAREPLALAAHLLREHEQLEPEGRRLGVDAVGAADARRVPVLARAPRSTPRSALDAGERAARRRPGSGARARCRARRSRSCRSGRSATSGPTFSATSVRNAITSWRTRPRSPRCAPGRPRAWRGSRERGGAGSHRARPCTSHTASSTSSQRAYVPPRTRSRHLGTRVALDHRLIRLRQRRNTCTASCSTSRGSRSASSRSDRGCRPCPGSNAPVSLTSASRLSSDSIRSPTIPDTASDQRERDRDPPGAAPGAPGDQLSKPALKTSPASCRRRTHPGALDGLPGADPRRELAPAVGAAREVRAGVARDHDRDREHSRKPPNSGATTSRAATSGPSASTTTRGTRAARPRARAASRRRRPEEGARDARQRFADLARARAGRSSPRAAPTVISTVAWYSLPR